MEVVLFLKTKINAYQQIIKMGFYFKIFLKTWFIYFRFGEDSQNRVVNWIEQSSVQISDPIIDLGCGNGIILIELVNFTKNFNDRAVDLCSEYA